MVLAQTRLLILRISGLRLRVAAYPASAEDVAVCKELRGKIPDGQSREDNLGARGCALVELVVDDVPLCIHDRLVLGRVAQTNLEAKCRTCIRASSH